MAMSEEVLISLVEGYEELYNLRHPHYHIQQRRDNIWEEIGDIMNESGKTCRERWTKIRDNHRKALQLRKTKSGQAAMNVRPPKFNKELNFLVPYLQDDENRSSNIPSIDHISNTEQSTLNSPVYSVTSPFASPQGDSLGFQSWSANSGTRRARSRNSEDNSTTRARSRNSEANSTAGVRSRNSGEYSTASVLKEYLEHRERVRNAQATPGSSLYSDEQDPLIGFFINMARTVKDFPIQEQIIIKNEIFSIVNNTELRLAIALPTPEITTELQSQPQVVQSATNATSMISAPVHHTQVLRDVTLTANNRNISPIPLTESDLGNYSVFKDKRY